MSDQWTCIECGDAHANEHAACSCDDTCIEHIETIKRLRECIDEQRREFDAMGATYESERGAARDSLASLRSALAAATSECERLARWLPVIEAAVEWRQMVDVNQADVRLADAVDAVLREEADSGE